MIDRKMTEKLLQVVNLPVVKFPVKKTQVAGKSNWTPCASGIVEP